MAPNRTRAKRWVFTLNNYTAGEEQLLTELFESDHATYGVFGREVGENETPHLQGYIHFSDGKSLRQAKALIGDRAHLEVSRGTPQQASNYCKKDGDFVEIGTLTTNQGQRKDFDALKEWILSNDERPDMEDLFTEFPKMIIYRDAVSRLVDILRPIPPPPLPTLRPWQQELAEHLSTDPDDRTIRFLVDPVGNQGKTFFARDFSLRNKGVQILGVAKRDDMAYAIDPDCKYFFINVPRGEMQFLQYSVLEMLKDGIVFSPKYDSRTKMLRKTPHVVVLSNEFPDMTRMSVDRYDIKELTPQVYEA
jgi:hypothetical protein